MRVIKEISRRSSEFPFVAFVGAGFSVGCGMPTFHQLMHDLYLRLKSSSADEKIVKSAELALSRRDYLSLSDILGQHLPEFESQIFLRQALSISNLQHLPDEKRLRADKRLRLFASGPWRGVITTNYDELIEEAYRRIGSPIAKFFPEHLGVLFPTVANREPFLIKIHGDLTGPPPVMNTPGYVKTWVTNPRIETFLSAVMLHYSLIFIGCSLEPRLLDLRLKFCETFGNSIPPCYAILPASSFNIGRQTSLERYHGIKSVFYPPGDYDFVDKALTVFADHSLEDFDFRFFVKSKSSQNSVKTQLLRIGVSCRSLLRAICQYPSSLSYSSFSDNTLRNLKLPPRVRHVLLHLSDRERFLRLTFLSQTDLLKVTSTQRNDPVFVVPPMVTRALEAIKD